jgi:predicted nucleic acid-binding protein
MTALLDTGFLLAVLDADDTNHDRCVLALKNESTPLLPAVVLPELAHLVLRDLGVTPFRRFLDAIEAGELTVVPHDGLDLPRTREILAKCADDHVSYVDCAIVALAERLKVKRIFSLDRQHFDSFKPQHCANFEILPG